MFSDVYSDMIILNIHAEKWEGFIRVFAALATAITRKFVSGGSALLRNPSWTPVLEPEGKNEFAHGVFAFTSGKGPLGWVMMGGYSSGTHLSGRPEGRA